MGGDNADDSGDGDGSDRSNPMLREQDRFLPIANVARIMKKTIPRTGKVQKHVLFSTTLPIKVAFKSTSIQSCFAHISLLDCQGCTRMCSRVCF